MANSGAFGRQGEVTDIEQAILILGLRSVNVIALSFSLVATSSGETDLKFDYRHYWTCSAVTTTAAHYLSEHYCPEVKDEAFLAGILCDFAQLAMAECAPEKYGTVLSEFHKSNDPLQEIEKQVLGTDYMTLGKQLLESWDLPEVIYASVGSHHNPELIEDKSSSAYKVSQILYLAAICGDLYAGGDINISVEALRQAGAAYFDMDDVHCQNFLQDIQERVPEIIDILNIKSSDPNELMNIRAQATEYIVKESLALNQEAQAITNNAKRLEKKNIELEDQAITDALTGLRNRGFFDSTIKDILECSTQNGNAMGLLILDIDHFKSVNDSYGHQNR